MYVVSNKVDDEEFEYEMKTATGSSFSRHFDQISKKLLQI